MSSIAVYDRSNVVKVMFPRTFKRASFFGHRGFTFAQLYQASHLFREKNNAECLLIDYRPRRFDADCKILIVRDAVRHLMSQSNIQVYKYPTMAEVFYESPTVFEECIKILSGHFGCDLSSLRVEITKYSSEKKRIDLLANRESRLTFRLGTPSPLKFGWIQSSASDEFGVVGGGDLYVIACVNHSRNPLTLIEL